MARYDTVVTGGRIVVPYHERDIMADVAIKDGRIVAIAESIGHDEADEVIDASGKAVFPGAVDCHYHLGIFRDLATDTRSETASCTVGGVTTVVSYFRTGQHYLNKSGPYREIFPEVLQTVAGNAKVDYGFHLAPMTAEHVREMPWLVTEMGVSSFKYYMFYKGLNLSGSSRDSRAYTLAEEYDLGHLYEIMESAARIAAAEGKRISVSVHCEQPELLRIFIERAKRDPALSGLREYSAGRPPLTERLSVEEAGVLADATGVSVNFLHLSSELALSTAVEVARRYPHADLRREVTLHHLALACADLDGKGPGGKGPGGKGPGGKGLGSGGLGGRGLGGRGLGGKVNPPIRDRSDNEALWRGVASGEVTWVASDHACCMESEKGDDLWPAQPGFGGTALLYPLLISEGHHKRGLPLSKIAELASAAPARAYNLFGTKGTIAVGADADLAIVDLDLEQVVTPELCQSAQDHTPFEGKTVRGWPVMTLLRGQKVFDKGEVTDAFPGQFVRR